MNNTYKSLSRNRRLALCGAFSALVIVLTFTNLGFISFSPVISITILPIPVILAATLGGLPEGIIVGFSRFYPFKRLQVFKNNPNTLPQGLIFLGIFYENCNLSW